MNLPNAKPILPTLIAIAACGTDPHPHARETAQSTSAVLAISCVCDAPSSTCTAGPDISRPCFTASDGKCYGEVLSCSPTDCSAIYEYPACGDATGTQPCEQRCVTSVSSCSGNIVDVVDECGPPRTMNDYACVANKCSYSVNGGPMVIASCLVDFELH